MMTGVKASNLILVQSRDDRRVPSSSGLDMYRDLAALSAQRSVRNGNDVLQAIQLDTLADHVAVALYGFNSDHAPSATSMLLRRWTGPR
jgi:hypothetical protein